MISKRHVSQLLAVFIQANMVWVFLACALQCVAAVEPACSRDEPDTCCLATVVEAGNGIAMSAPETYSCLLVPRELAVTVDRNLTPDERHAAPSNFAVPTDDSMWRPRSDVPRSGVDPPAKWRPLDRLPVIRV